MSILKQQNINNLNIGLVGAPGQIKDEWYRNLGRNNGHEDTPSAGRGFGGYDYSPPGLTKVMISYRWRQGPQGELIFGNGAEHQYGPRFFSKLPNDKVAGQTFEGSHSSLLGAFATMIGARSPKWGENTSSQNMKQSFVLMGGYGKSLWNKNRGINGTAIASGTPTKGYESGHEYGINNWQADGTTQSEISGDKSTWAAQLGDLIGDGNISLEEGQGAAASLKEHGDASKLGPLGVGREEVTNKRTIEHTGLRNIPFMAGPQ